MLLNNKRLPVTQDALNDIFECGMSESSLQNKFFAKNQLLTSKGKNARCELETKKLGITVFDTSII